MCDVKDSLFLDIKNLHFIAMKWGFLKHGIWSSLSYVGAPHEFLLQVLYERVFLAAYYELFVVGFTHCDYSRFVAALVASVKGYEKIVAAAVDLYGNFGAVVYYQRSCTEAVWCLADYCHQRCSTSLLCQWCTAG